MKKDSAFLGVLLGLFAAIPGLNNLSETIPLQPFANKTLMWSVVTAVSTICILYLYYIRHKKLPWLLFSIVSLIAFCVCILGYFKLYNSQVVEYMGQMILFPMELPDILKQELRYHPNRAAFLEYWGPDGAKQFIDRASGQLDKTELRFAFLYVGTFLFLTVTFIFGLFAIRKRKDVFEEALAD